MLKAFSLSTLLLLILGGCATSNSPQKEDSKKLTPMVPKDLHFTEKDQTIINQPDQATGQEAYEIGKSYLYHYRDEQKAFEWFRRAASLGNQDARVYLDEINQYN